MDSSTVSSHAKKNSSLVLTMFILIVLVALVLSLGDCDFDITSANSCLARLERVL